MGKHEKHRHDDNESEDSKVVREKILLDRAAEAGDGPIQAIADVVRELIISDFHVLENQVSVRIIGDMNIELIVEATQKTIKKIRHHLPRIVKEN